MRLIKVYVSPEDMKGLHSIKLYRRQLEIVFMGSSYMGQDPMSTVYAARSFYISNEVLIGWQGRDTHFGGDGITVQFFVPDRLRLESVDHWTLDMTDSDRLGLAMIALNHTRVSTFDVGHAITASKAPGSRDPGKRETRSHGQDRGFAYDPNFGIEPVDKGFSIVAGSPRVIATAPALTDRDRAYIAKGRPAITHKLMQEAERLPLRAKPQIEDLLDELYARLKANGIKNEGDCKACYTGDEVTFEHTCMLDARQD